jgi:YD repeat-containing protein
LVRCSAACSAQGTEEYWGSEKGLDVSNCQSVGHPTQQVRRTLYYQYNQANQRVRTTLADGSFWIYEYDSLGQMILERRHTRSRPAVRPMPRGGWGGRIIDGHEMGGHYYGYAAGAMPMSWTVSASLSASVSVSFRWDNCCGSKAWKYECSPSTEPGVQRSRYSGSSWPGAVDLYSRLISGNW